MQIPRQAESRATDRILGLMDELFQNCILNHITDLHLEPQGLIRLRQHQVLLEYPAISAQQTKQMRLRFKVLANLDVNQESLPQDGHCLWLGPSGTQTLACRISTCPTWQGEKMVVRLLTQQKLKLTWKNLGLEPWQQTIIEEHSQRPSGLVVINGPTGSGKTTTLYTLLEHLQPHQQNIVSIEDPIEIPNLNFCQIELNKALGFDIEHCLRSVLRQDPDLIMIGEIRDEKTARLALSAAQTGHLVFTSLHASHNIGVIARLHDLGLQPQHLLPYLNLLVAQRMQASKPRFELLEVTERIQQQLMSSYYAQMAR